MPTALEAINNATTYPSTTGTWDGTTSLNSGLNMVSPYTQNGLSYTTGGYVPSQTEYGGSSAGAILGSQYNPTPTVNTPYVDPYEQWGGEQSYNNLVAGVNQGLSDTHASSNSAFDNFWSRYNLDAGDLSNDARLGQRSIDNRMIDNYSNQAIGSKNINEMVGQGIQSGGVILANRNAGDSSGAEGIARAYGTLGNRRMGDVNNQFARENRKIETAQTDFDTAQAAGMNRLKVEADIGANEIILAARNEISALRREQLGQDLPVTIEIEQEIQKVKDRSSQVLADLDTKLATDMAAINPMESNTAQSQGISNMNEGRAPTGNFDYTTSPTTNMPGAALPSSLPIYTYRGANKDEV